jgi:hypothetical protein
MKVNKTELNKYIDGMSKKAIAKVIEMIESTDKNGELKDNSEYMMMINGTKTQKLIADAFNTYIRHNTPKIVSTPAQAKRDAKRMERDYNAIAYRMPKASQTIIENIVYGGNK